MNGGAEPNLLPVGEIKALTGARFLAAAWVLVFHSLPFIQYPAFLNQIVKQGKVGVAFFFVLSGFVLAHVYAKRFGTELVRSERTSFYWHRFARVYPLHALTHLLSIPIGIVTFGAIFSGPKLVLSWFAGLVLLQVYLPTLLFEQVWNAPAWSISCEAFFYALFPFLIIGLNRIKRPGLVTLFSLFLGSAFMLIVVFEFWHRRSPDLAVLAARLDYFAYRNPLCRIFEFAAGAVLYLSIRRKEKFWLRILETPRARSMTLVFSLAWLGAIAFLPGYLSVEDPGQRVFLEVLQWYVLPFPAITGIVASLGTGTTLISPILESRPFQLLGEASYALYMIHWLTWVPMSLHPELPLKWLLILFTVIGSIGIYQFIERPTRTWIRNCTSPRTTASEVQLAK